MTIYNNINEFNSRENTILTIGTFDGVHLGHQKVLERLTNSAIENNLESTVLTFFPHPRTILNPDKPLKLINSVKERTDLLKRSKINNLIIHPFDKSFSELDPEKYVLEILVKKLKAKIILIGYDHKFGKNRTADINDLILYGEKYDFKVIEIKAEEISNIAISCLLYTSDAADEEDSVDLGGRRIIKKKKKRKKRESRWIYNKNIS